MHSHLTWSVYVQSYKLASDDLTWDKFVSIRLKEKATQMSSLNVGTIFLYDETLFCGVRLYFHPTGLGIFNSTLFYRHTFRQVAWLVYVGAFDNGNVVA